jgi:hypothetical protein
MMTIALRRRVGERMIQIAAWSIDCEALSMSRVGSVVAVNGLRSEGGS